MQPGDDRRADSIRRRRGERGQATVEFALVLPVLALAAWSLVAVAVVGAWHLEIGHAARVAVRVATVDPDPEAPRIAAEAATSLAPLRVAVDTSDGLVTARVSVAVTVPVPLPGIARPRLTLTGTATMAREGSSAP